MRREYAGAARKARLAAPLGGSALDLGILGDDLSGWPDGTGGPFFVVIGRGTISEEKILCESRTANSITVYTDGIINGRGADGTTITSHSVDDYLEHVFTATDADEANEHVNSTANVHGVTSNLVGVSDTQTLTNKSIDGNANTLTNIPQSAVTGLVADIADIEAVNAAQTVNITNVTNANIATQAEVDALEIVVDTKAPINNPTFTGTVTLPATTSIGSVTGSEIQNLDGTIANLQTQINGITGGGVAVPPGGEQDWVLIKKSNADYDMEWVPWSSLVFAPASGNVNIYPDGALSSTDHIGTGTFTVGSQVYRWYSFTTVDQDMIITADDWTNDGNTGVIGKLLLVAGGGGGGGYAQSSGDGASGGGAGGLWYGDYPFGVGDHLIRIGGGGAGGVGVGLFGNGFPGVNGGDTWIDHDILSGTGGIVAPGGGGGQGVIWAGGGTGLAGGSGGGGGGAGGAGTPGFGYAGGANGEGGTGGGAGGTGSIGGPGVFLNMNGASLEYAKGGPGNSGVEGTAGRGFGGGGAPNAGTGFANGAAGGSGVIIFNYRIA